MPKLTKRVVDWLKPRTATEIFVWDSEVKGLGIRIKPSGTRSYLIQYRNQARRTRRMVLGHCGVLSLEEARGLAREKLVEVIKGEDPSAARKTLLRSRTVADLCHWYLAEAESGRLLGRKRRPTGILVVKFLLLSGFRRNEVLQLQTSWLGKNFSHVAFPDTKTGRQVRIIGKAAADLIRTRCRGRDITYVF